MDHRGPRIVFASEGSVVAHVQIPITHVRLFVKRSLAGPLFLRYAVMPVAREVRQPISLDSSRKRSPADHPPHVGLKQGD